MAQNQEVQDRAIYLKSQPMACGFRRGRDKMTTEESMARPGKPKTYPIPKFKGTVTGKIYQGPTFTRTRQISGLKTMTQKSISGSLTTVWRAFPGEAFKDKLFVSWPQRITQRLPKKALQH